MRGIKFAFSWSMGAVGSLFAAPAIGDLIGAEFPTELRFAYDFVLAMF